MEKADRPGQDMRDKANPFGKRDILQRTPPRARAGSMSEIEERVIAESAVIVLEQTNKRKRTEEIDDSGVGSPDVGQLQRVFGEIQKQVEKLEKVLADMYKPKQELKDISSKLTLEAEKLRDTDFNKWSDQVVLETQELRKEKEELSRRLTYLESKPKVREDESIQNLTIHCSECTKAKNKEEKRNRLTNQQSYDNFQAISEDDWLEDVLPKITEDPRCVWEAPADCQIVLPCNQNLETQEKTVRKAIDVFGDTCFWDQYKCQDLRRRRYPGKKAKSASAKEQTREANREEAKKPKQDAILVALAGKSYADLLRTVKQTVRPGDIGVDIKDVRKTKKGELLLTVRNGSDKAEVLKNELREKLPTATTSLLVSKKVLHVKGMDEVVTTQEIKDAICKAIETKPETFEVKALRPAYGNRQNATIVMPEGDARKLIQARKIKIGWTSCKIVERKPDLKCYKCWDYGHTKSECTGPDREWLCLKCAKEGHKAVLCPNEPYCVYCKQEAPQPGSSVNEGASEIDNIDHRQAKRPVAYGPEANLQIFNSRQINDQWKKESNVAMYVCQVCNASQQQERSYVRLALSFVLGQAENPRKLFVESAAADARNAFYMFYIARLPSLQRVAAAGAELRAPCVILRIRASGESAQTFC
ncbi:zinc finger cchc-type superfamily [Holotrichia oblita]|uniref:Zinc finger cchc-type superfamily n=1 Tax=Holotrichia oblita TaxID=644536 RepID=A0ACB9T2M0_HOLOL|nr:zinc finger cchc-type superfamily [Holotrichia oblita]